jgi:hypothetical protein
MSQANITKAILSITSPGTHLTPGNFTNAHGVYLGDESLTPLFEELDRRNVTVFVYPTSPCIRGAHDHDLQPASPLAQVLSKPHVRVFL